MIGYRVSAPSRTALDRARRPRPPFPQLKERWGFVSMGPVAMLRQPLGSASQTQPNGPRAPIHVRHREREVGRREPVEPELPALRQQLPEVVSGKLV